MNAIFALIDDDADDRMLFCEAAEALRSGIIPLASGDGLQLAELLKQQVTALPGIIFLDINMPEKDGWFFLDLLRKDDTLTNVPVIMYSTSANKTDIDKATRLGARFLLNKPDDFDELKSCFKTIKTHLDDATLDALPFAVDKWFLR